MNGRIILTKAIEVVGALFLAFGGALLKVQPAGNDGSTGFIASFGALLILLIIWALIRNVRYSKMQLIWLASGILFTAVFVFAFQNYKQNIDKYTIGLPPENPSHFHIIGDSLTQFGMDHSRDFETLAILVDRTGGIEAIPAIWKEESIKRISQRLTMKYLWLVVFLTSAIFSLTEGAFSRRTPATTTKTKTKPTPTTKTD